MPSILPITSDVKETGDRLAQHVDDLRSDVKKIGDDLKDHVSAHADLAMGKANDSYQQFRFMAQEKVFVCIGVAFVVGYLLALFRSRS